MSVSYLKYLNICYDICNGKKVDDDEYEDKFYLIHICTKQIFNQIKKLCLKSYDKINIKFGLYACSIAINCCSMDELKHVLYSLFSSSNQNIQTKQLKIYLFY